MTATLNKAKKKKVKPHVFLKNTNKSKTGQDVSAALMCKQFLKDHFLFKVWKERRSQIK